MRAGRVVIVIAAALLTLVGFGALVGGGALVLAHATQRDSDGYYQSPTERLQSATAVLMTRTDLGAPGPDTWGLDHPVGTLRIKARSTGQSPLFIGIGPAVAVAGWLAGTSYERVNSVNYWPLRSETDLVAGAGRITPPGDQQFWTASASGTGEQTLVWLSEPGEWTIVLMNADARPGVSADVAVGAATELLLPVGTVVGGLGLFLLLGSIMGMVLAVRGTSTATGGDAATTVGVPGSYPVRLDAHLDPGLSRWLWLVKWILVIPHWFVLALLWLAALPLTMVAGFAILFTGRYPRSIFDFNVGVMRWSWRVSYYAFSALGTDRYPPFSLHPDPGFPADLAVEYPRQLSRGLVLVKWWLLAIPHYIVVALFAGGWSGWFGWRGDDWRFAAGGGLIGILVVVAAVILLVTGAYPKPVFDFVMGMNRWCYRVLAYAALMRDEYPPFRLDTGGPDPGSVPVDPTTPTTPEGTDHLVTTAPSAG